MGLNCSRKWNLQSTDEKRYEQDYFVSQWQMKAFNLSKGKTKNQNINEELQKAYDKKYDVKIDTMRQKLCLPKT